MTLLKTLLNRYKKKLIALTSFGLLFHTMALAQSGPGGVELKNNDYHNPLKMWYDFSDWSSLDKDVDDGGNLNKVFNQLNINQHLQVDGGFYNVSDGFSTGGPIGIKELSYGNIVDRLEVLRNGEIIIAFSSSESHMPVYGTYGQVTNDDVYNGIGLAAGTFTSYTQDGEYSNNHFPSNTVQTDNAFSNLNIASFRGTAPSGYSEGQLEMQFATGTPQSNIFFNFSPPSFGLHSLSTASSHSGFIHEIIGFNRRLTPFERQIVFTYLSGKYNIPYSGALAYADPNTPNFTCNHEIQGMGYNGIENKTSAFSGEIEMEFSSPVPSTGTSYAFLGHDFQAVLNSLSYNLNIYDSRRFLQDPNNIYRSINLPFQGSFNAYPNGRFPQLQVYNRTWQYKETPTNAVTKDPGSIRFTVKGSAFSGMPAGAGNKPVLLVSKKSDFPLNNPDGPEYVTWVYELTYNGFDNKYYTTQDIGQDSYITLGYLGPGPCAVNCTNPSDANQKTVCYVEDPSFLGLNLEVGGIEQYIPNSTTSAFAVSIDNPEALQDDPFTFSIVANKQPAAFNGLNNYGCGYFKMLDKTWCVFRTVKQPEPAPNPLLSNDALTFTFQFKPSRYAGSADLNGGYLSYVLFVDEDGDGNFANAIPYFMSSNGQGVWTASGVSVPGTAKIGVGMDFMEIYTSSPQSFNIRNYLNSAPNCVEIKSSTGTDADRGTIHFKRYWKYTGTSNTTIRTVFTATSLNDDGNLWNMAPRFHQVPVVLVSSTPDFSADVKVYAQTYTEDDYLPNYLIKQYSCDYTIPVPPNSYISYGLVQHYATTSEYTNEVGSLGRTNEGYTKNDISSPTYKEVQLNVNKPNTQIVDIADYLLLRNNGAVKNFSNAGTLNGVNYFATDRKWLISRYGTSRTLDFSISPTEFGALPSNTDSYGLLVDKTGNGEYQLYGMVKQGDRYFAYNLSIADGGSFTVVAFKYTNTHCAHAQQIAPLQNGTIGTLLSKPCENVSFASPCSLKTVKNTLYVAFNTGDLHSFGDKSGISASISCSYKIYRGGVVAEQNTIPAMALDKTTPEKIYTYTFPGEFDKVELTVTAFNSTTANGFNLAQNLKLVAEVKSEYQLQMPDLYYSSLITDQAKDEASPFPQGGTEFNTYKFQWSTDHCPVEKYQFQLVRLFNGYTLLGGAPTGPEDNIQSTVDWNNALSIDLPTNEITLTMAEGTGYYAWRVRPIGNAYPGEEADSRNWGVWSTANAGYEIPEFVGLFNKATTAQKFKGTVFYYNQFSEDKNFIYNRVFTEGALQHEGFTIANALQQLVQSQAKVATSSTDGWGNILTTQTYYDVNARPFVTTLPSPDAFSSFGYRSDLLINGAGQLITKYNIEKANNTAADLVVGGSVRNYYSTTNTSDYIPDSEGFPYVRSKFSTDGTGKVIEQSGVGATFKLGGGHTVTTEYGNPTVDELFEMFGDEAPLNTSVEKTSVKDQNGVISYSYADKAGRVIATSVFPKKPEGSPLHTLTGPTREVKDVIEENLPWGGSGLRAVAEYIISEKTDFKVDYEITPNVYKAMCTYINSCVTCGYDMELKVINMATGISAGQLTSPIMNSALTAGACSTGAPLPVTPLTILDLAPGRYRVEKTTTPKKSGEDAAVDAVKQQMMDAFANVTQQFAGLEIIRDINIKAEYILNNPSSIQPTGGQQTLSVHLLNEDGVVLNTPTSWKEYKDGYKLRISAECCTLHIPLRAYVLDPCLEYKANAYTEAEVATHMATYASTKLGANYLTLTKSFGVNDESKLKDLFYNMLWEKKNYASQSAEYKAKYKVYDNYGCENLMQCWKAAVTTFAPTPTLPAGVTKPGQGGTTEYPQTTQFETPAGTVDKTNLTNGGNVNTPRLDEIFLNCTGIAYAGYTTDATSDALKARGYQVFYYDRNTTDLVKQSVHATCEQIFCDPTTRGLNYDEQSKEWKNAQGNSVKTADLSDPAYDSDKFCSLNPTGCTITQGSGSGFSYSYNTLSITSPTPAYSFAPVDYYSLKQCVTGMQNMQAYTGKANMEMASDFSRIEANANQLKISQDMEEACQKVCGGKYEDFLQKLKALYWNPTASAYVNTYTSTTLTEEDICCMASAMVDQCKLDCQLTPQVKVCTTPALNVLNVKWYYRTSATGQWSQLSASTADQSFTALSTDGAAMALPSGLNTATYLQVKAKLEYTNLNSDVWTDNCINTYTLLSSLSSLSVKLDLANGLQVFNGTQKLNPTKNFCKGEAIFAPLLTGRQLVLAPGTPKEIATVQSIQVGSIDFNQTDPSASCSVGYKRFAPWSLEQFSTRRKCGTSPLSSNFITQVFDDSDYGYEMFYTSKYIITTNGLDNYTYHVFDKNLNKVTALYGLGQINFISYTDVEDELLIVKTYSENGVLKKKVELLDMDLQVQKTIPLTRFYRHAYKYMGKIFAFYLNNYTLGVDVYDLNGSLIYNSILPAFDSNAMLVYDKKGGFYKIVGSGKSVTINKYIWSGSQQMVNILTNHSIPINYDINWQFPWNNVLFAGDNIYLTGWTDCSQYSTNCENTTEDRFWVARIDNQTYQLKKETIGGVFWRPMGIDITPSGDILIPGDSDGEGWGNPSGMVGGTDYWVLSLDKDLNWKDPARIIFGSSSYDNVYGGFYDKYTSAYYIIGNIGASSGCNTFNYLKNINCTSNPSQKSHIVKYAPGGSPCHPENLCYRWTPMTNTGDPWVVDEPETPDLLAAEDIKNQMSLQLENCKFAKEERVRKEYKENCGAKFTDKTTVTYNISQGQYTLYYYDRSGNLVRTVPPEGVELLSLDPSKPNVLPYSTNDTPAKIKNREVATKHRMVTQYKYNSLGQLVEQSTPDGGVTRFTYNRFGQLRFSQSARQAGMTPQRYSYTKYDLLGRIVEVGEARLGTAYTSAASFAGMDNESYLQDGENPVFGFDQIPNGTETLCKTEKVVTVYSEPVVHPGFRYGAQRNLLNRVSYTYSHDLERDKKTTSYYSYDAHGNVEWMVQELPGFSTYNLAYEYDLISNKVTKVKYNEGLADQLFHRYEYDADNRITQAYTSTNGVIWDRDANYNYYKHGPLRRTELGEDRIQGLDYIYTLQGWLKSVNHPQGYGLDPGKDGSTTNPLVAKDAFGMRLNYFTGDFACHATASASNDLGSGYIPNSLSLYNGNIASWEQRTHENFTGSAIDYGSTAQAFQYDLLNRIRQSDFYKGTAGTYTASNFFHTEYTYDGNGNLMTLKRNSDDGSLMDNFSYKYNSETVATNTKTYNNLLKAVVDDVSGSPTAEDLESGQSASTYPSSLNDNYQYDASGNLIEDKQEKVKITWNSFGKVAEVLPERNTTNPNAQKPSLRYFYDASGQRILKEVNRKPYADNGALQRLAQHIETHAYARDATGNVMAIYDRENTLETSTQGTAKFTLSEQPIYGSSRLGLLNYINKAISEVKFTVGEENKTIYSNDLPLQRSSELINWLQAKKGTKRVRLIGSLYRNIPTIKWEMSQYNAATGTFAVSQLSNAFAVVTFGRATFSSESDAGVLNFYGHVAKEVSGQKNVCQLYDKGNMLMPTSSGIIASGSSQAVTVQYPGSSTKHILITRGTDWKLRYHVVDMAAVGNGTLQAPKGDVILKNQGIASPKGFELYAHYLTAAEDRKNNRAFLYTMGAFAGEPAVLLVYEFYIGPGGVLSVREHNKVASVDERPWNSDGQGGLRISPDGTKLAVLLSGSPSDWFAQSTLTLWTYKLGSDFLPLTQEQSPVVRSELPMDASLDVDMDFDADSRRLLVHVKGLTENTSEANSEHVLWSYDLAGNAWTQLGTGLQGPVRRAPDGRVYASTGTLLTAYKGDSYTITAEPSRTIALSTGELPLQNYKSYAAQVANGLVYARTVGTKRYELNDHLGNVTAVVSDQFTLESGLKKPTLLAYYNYYAFGASMPGRQHASNEYRYGYNGKEKDRDFLNNYDYGFRIYNANIAKFLSVDPLTDEYPWYTPYQFAGNTPIWAIDLDGLEPWFMPFALASRSTPVIRPITETIVKTQVGKPKWNSSSSVAENMKNIFKTGREAHVERQTQWETEGFATEQTVGKGNRLDGIKIEKSEGLGTIRELKSNSTGGKRAGYKQLRRYIDAAIKEFPEITEWQPELELYHSKTGVMPSDATNTMPRKKLTIAEGKENKSKNAEKNKLHEEYEIEQKRREDCPLCI